MRPNGDLTKTEMDEAASKSPELFGLLDAIKKASEEFGVGSQDSPLQLVVVACDIEAEVAGLEYYADAQTFIQLLRLVASRYAEDNLGGISGMMDLLPDLSEGDDDPGYGEREV